MSMITRVLRLHGAVALAAAFASAAAAGAQPATVYVDELTSPELRQLVASGTTIVLIPIGGTEQNGPHMVLGKHNVRVHVLAGEIARRLGNAVVAPVVAYVPEGPVLPTGHMRYAGTISVPDAAFDAVLAGAARSFRQHGFRAIYFLGDHGGYQKNEERVAAALDREWKDDPSFRVHALTDYYRAAEAFDDDLRQRGFGDAQIGTHAGLADTALALAVDPSLVRADRLGRPPTPGDGTRGDPRQATAALGDIGVRHIVDASVAAIRRFEQNAATRIQPAHK
ncbi:MAG: creatininase family protein [Burkholderiaceae bacterium]